jgi:hypothetical protein
MSVNHQCHHLGDDYTASVEAEFTRGFSVDSYTSKIEAEFGLPFLLCRVESDDDDDDDDSDSDDVSWLSDEEERPHERKERAPNAYDYKFGNVYEANWYGAHLLPVIP